MGEPLLSILITTYNREALLRSCLESLRGVGIDCEIVVCDNASADGTAAMIAAYSQDEPRLRYVRHAENIGALANFNGAMAEARGRYFCLLGDDDLSLPGNFERKIALLEANPQLGLVYSLAHRLDADGGRHDPLRLPGIAGHGYVGGRIEWQDLLVTCYMQLQTVVFRRDLWQQLGGFDPDPGLGTANDWDMMIRHAAAGETAFIPVPLVAVRFHTANASHDFRRAGGFAQGRLALWRKWLLDREPLPVLAPATWAQMREALRTDLDYDLGYDRATIRDFLAEFDALEAAHRARHEARLAATLASAGGPPLPARDVGLPIGRPMAVCACWRCRTRRFLLHRRR